MSGNQKPTYFYATLSTVIVLILISLFLLLFFHSNNITNIVKENINLLVELEDQIPTTEINYLKKTISAYPGVIPASIDYVSKEDALKLMSAELNISQNEAENPFKGLIKFNLSHEAYGEALIQDIKSKIELEKGVIGLYYENESVDLVKSNLEKLSIGILILALCFVILAASIIFNTIKLTLYSDLKQIKTMQMVGAEKAFIKKPYLRLAFLMSFKATLSVAIVLALFCLYFLKSESIFAEIIQWKYVGLTLVLSSLIAFVIQLTATNAILNQFLKREGR